MKYRYRVTSPILPKGATSSVMSYGQMEDWLNTMDDQGWEFVGYGQKNWINATAQSWWIFRKHAGKAGKA